MLLRKADEGLFSVTIHLNPGEEVIMGVLCFMVIAMGILSISYPDVSTCL
jgi:hypothetical protein